MKAFSRQHARHRKHPRFLMFTRHKSLKLLLFTLLTSILLSSGCSVFKPSIKQETATLLKTEDAAVADLFDQINNIAKVNSLYGKIDLKFEDNSFAETGVAEKYKTAPGSVAVQRPGSILLEIQLPVFLTDIAKMTSDGEKFRVAILEDGAGGKYKQFVVGTNDADYSVLQEKVKSMEFENGGKVLKQNVNAFANLRPQHFTDAILMRPIDTSNFFYTQSTIFQEEFDLSQKKKSPLRWVLRGYYVLDELGKNEDGSLSVSRRFWFDRVGSVRLARQQIFDSRGEIDSDIIYGKAGTLTETGEYQNMPHRIEVTRPKEKYKMSLEYQSPQKVIIGKDFPNTAFVLENRWNLPVVDLDKKLLEVSENKVGEELKAKSEK